MPSPSTLYHHQIMSDRAQRGAISVIRGQILESNIIYWLGYYVASSWRQERHFFRGILLYGGQILRSDDDDQGPNIGRVQRRHGANLNSDDFSSVTIIVGPLGSFRPSIITMVFSLCLLKSSGIQPSPCAIEKIWIWNETVGLQYLLLGTKKIAVHSTF